MTAYYNEIDAKAAATLRELIRAGLIAGGIVDERSIAEVQADDLQEFTQCHFFAGAGVWSYALRLAGWRDDRRVWTGSCPCQPFSAAGKGKGTADDRHLWPEWHRLIAECRPAIVMGEQVASADVLGKSVDEVGQADARDKQPVWIDVVSADLESAHYSCSAIDSPASCVGAPHIRQRIYFVALDLANANSRQCSRQSKSEKCESNRAQTRRHQSDSKLVSNSRLDCLENLYGKRCDGQRVCVQPGQPRQQDIEAAWGGEAMRPGPTNGHWRDADWLGCTDGKWRPVSASTLEVANGTSADMGRVCYPRAKIEGTEEINEMQSLRQNFDPKEIRKRRLGKPVNAEAQEVLQQKLHGGGNGKRTVCNGNLFQAEVGDKSEVKLRSMRSEAPETACSSQERRSVRQQAVQLDDALSKLPPGSSFAKLFEPGCSQTLYTLLGTDDEVWPLFHSFKSAQTTWRSLGEEAKDRARVGFAKANFRWRMASPLRKNEPYRAARLRLYGNAIVAQHAQAFIKAVMAEI